MTKSPIISYLSEKGQLAPKSLVMLTVMSNLGYRPWTVKTFKAEEVAAVGDRYVVEKK